MFVKQWFSFTKSDWNVKIWCKNLKKVIRRVPKILRKTYMHMASSLSKIFQKVWISLVSKERNSLAKLNIPYHSDISSTCAASLVWINMYRLLSRVFTYSFLLFDISMLITYNSYDNWINSNFASFSHPEWNSKTKELCCYLYFFQKRNLTIVYKI